MITFKNIAGNKSLAVGTIKRKSALNGEKSLTGNLYDGKDVLNKIDKGWSLEFDGEPYVVTYFERNDNDNSVSFDAIHKFFWDMTKKVLYSSTEISGSHTIKWYLDQIFANTGYTYALNFSPAAIEKDNWGNKTRLSLFNDLITSIAGEFEINGTLISIFQNIGTDLSTIVRYGFNLSDMTLENDATSFVTYGEGFGAYANQENQTGDRVHVTYTSPLAGVYGILQAEPIDDQRYTSQANLQAAVKSQVDASFSVSVQLSLYDLTAAGYPYKMANVGDWLTAVDENLDFKQRIRIISIDDEFSADGTRISYTVTAGDIGLTKKYQDANASMASQVANAIVSAGQASTDANFALIAANGKLTAYYVGSYDELPTTANEGDLGWVTSGDGRLLYIYTKKADGSYYWEKRIDPEMGDQIEAGVTEAVAQANAHTDEVKQGLSTDIDTAKSQAASLAGTAEANAKSAATSQFTQAQSALSAAKTDLTNSIASEASARNSAVAAANSQAQTYANQAKADAMSAASSADGVIRTAISSSANSLSATITQNKSSADSGISTAQTTAQAAVDGLKFKVSQTDYDQKTGDLSTKINDVKETADGSAQTIADIQEADGKRDSRILKVEKTAEGITSTVSDLSTAQDKQSGYISELQQSAKGFEGSIREINNTVNNLGQINQLFNTEFSPDFQSWSVDNPWGYANDGDYQGSVIMAAASNASNNYLEQSISAKSGQIISVCVYLRSIIDSNATTPGNFQVVIQAYNSANSLIGNYAINALTGNNPWKLYKIENQTLPTGTVRVRFVAVKRGAIYAYLAKPMIVFGSTIGTYVQGNYNNNDALAKVKLTADNASAAFSTLISADGIITKAQADIQANANEITKKVSQTDYDKVTGDLSTNLNKTTNTANGTQQALSDYKEYANGNISGISSDLTKLAGEVDLKLTKTDYDDDQSILNTSLSQWKADYDGLTGTVSKLSDKVNNLGQINQLFNTEFSPDGQGWIVGSGWGPSVNVPIWNSSYVYSISSSTGTSYLEQSLPVTAGTTFSLSANLKTFMSSTDTGTVNLFAIAYDSTGNTLSTLYYLTINQTLDFSNYKRENLVTPTGTSTIRFGIVKRGTISAYINQPMLVFASTVGSYVPGNYNNNAALAQVKITAEGINNFVRDSSGNISSDFQTALSKTSIITGSTLATSIKQQTLTHITSALADNNGKIISLINQDTSGVQISGKNIVLDGNTTVTGAFKVSQANIANGAIGTAQIGDAAITSAKIATIDAGKITTGTLTGVNVTVDKNLTMGTSGVMTWALSGSWRDYSFDPYYVYYRQDGNPNQYYVNTVQTGSLNISASNTGGSLTFNGSITAPNAASDTKSYYMYYPSDISTGTNTLYTRVNMGIGGVNVSSWGDPSNRGKNLGGYTSIGPTGLVATQNLNNLNSYVSVDGELGGGRLDLFYDFSKFSLAGNSASFRYTTANNLQIAAPAGIDIGGGTLTKIGSDTTASILLRSDSGGNAVVSTDVYARTYSYASNMYVTSAGTIGRATSASKYKLAITHYDELDRANKLLSIKPARWFDKAETEQYADELNGGDGYGEHLPVKPHFGLIAEDLVEAGLEEFVSYGADGQVEGLEYERVWTTLIPLIKNMKERIEELERKVA